MKKNSWPLTLLILFLSFSSLVCQELVLQNGHSKEVKIAQFSPDGQYIYSIGGDEKIKLYNSEGYLLKTIGGFKDKYLQGQYTADSKKLYLYSFLQDSVFRIDLSTLKIDQVVPITPGDTPFQVKGASSTQDGLGLRVLIADKDYQKEKADYKVVEIRPDGTSKVVREGGFVGDDYGSILGPKGNKLIHYPYVDNQSKTVLFDVETDKPIKEYSGGRSFKFTQNEKEVYELSPAGEDELATIRFYDSSTGNESRTIKLTTTETDEWDLYFKELNEVFYFEEVQSIVVRANKQYEGDRLLFFDLQGRYHNELRYSKTDVTALDISSVTNRMIVCAGSPGQNITIQTHLLYYKDYVSAHIKSLNDVSEAFQISFAQDSKSFVVSRKNGWSKVDLHGNVLKEEEYFSSPFVSWTGKGQYLLSTGYEKVMQYGSDGRLIKAYKLKNDPIHLVSERNSDMLLTLCRKHIYLINTKKREVVFEKSYEEFHEKTDDYIHSAAAFNDKFYVFSDKMVEVFDHEGQNLVDQQFENNVISNFMANQPMGFSSNTETIIGMPFSSRLFVLGVDGQIIKMINLPWVKFKGNGVSSTTMSPNGEHYAVGSTEGEVRVLDTMGNQLFFNDAHDNEVSSMAFSLNGKFLATGSIDGDIILWNAGNNYEKLLTYYVFENGEFLVMTPEGYYHASKGSLEKFIYFKDGKIYPFDNYDLKFNRPDIIMDKLSVMDVDIIKMYKKAYHKRLKRAGVSDNMLTANFSETPSVILPDTRFYQRVKSEKFSFRIEAQSPSGNLSKLFVYVNGSPVYGINGKNLDQLKQKRHAIDCSFNLNNGRNIVSVSVLNQEGVESLKRKFMVDYERNYTPTLHLMIIGVSEFQNKSMNLTYAAKDALDLKKQFKSSNPVYKKTKVYDLTNKNATKANVLKTLEQLKLTDPDDAVIVHVSSHGVLDAEMDYYLAMHDMDFNNPVDGGLSYDLLEEEISKIPSRKKVLMLDACHSGELDKEEFEVSSSSIYTEKGEVNFRSVGSQVNSRSIGFDNSLELSKRIFSDMKRSSGTLVLSSAGAVEYALESDEWKNGVFTFAILQGLKEAEADLNGDGEITFSELQMYVIDQVDMLTEGGQKPNIRTDNEYCEEVRIW